MLASYLHCPINDKTGLTGRYDVTLKWAPVESRSPVPFPADLEGASLFTAVQDQLGLRLEAQKNSALTVIVVDSAEKLRDNR